MTDRFEVPLPSAEAALVGWRVYDPRYCNPRAIHAALRAAYAVDLPAIVRAEFEAYFKWEEVGRKAYVARLKATGPLAAGFHPASPKGRAAYLAARFGEREEGVAGWRPGQCEAVLCAKDDDDEEPCLLPAGHKGDHHFESCAPRPSGEPETATAACALAEPPVRLTDIGYRLMSPAERAFLRALATALVNGKTIGSVEDMNTGYVCGQDIGDLGVTARALLAEGEPK